MISQDLIKFAEYLKGRPQDSHGIGGAWQLTCFNGKTIFSTVEEVCGLEEWNYVEEGLLITDEELCLLSEQKESVKRDVEIMESKKNKLEAEIRTLKHDKKILEKYLKY